MPAAHFCGDCEEALCGKCWPLVHDSGKRAAHVKLPVGGPRPDLTPICAEHGREDSLFCKDHVVMICDFCCLLPGAEHLGHACVPLVTHERQLRTGSGFEGAAAGAGVGFAAAAEASLSPLPLHLVPAGENEAAAALSRAGSMQGAETMDVQQASPPSTCETRWCAL